MEKHFPIKNTKKMCFKSIIMRKLDKANTMIVDRPDD
jgi:hypothetical protein